MGVTRKINAIHILCERNKDIPSAGMSVSERNIICLKV